MSSDVDIAPPILQSGRLPTLCLDFDGVIHSYTSGWVEMDFIPDPPVPGAFEFMYEATRKFNVVIFSSRSKEVRGIRAMATYIAYWAERELDNEAPLHRANAVINAICYNKDAFPTTKPSAFLTIDDRAWNFTGVWPTIEMMLAFKPWNKKQ